MVQVDIFWAYGLGASFAAAGGKQIIEEKSAFFNKYFVFTVLFLALIWAPTGMLLLLRHPGWETMQVAENLGSINEFVILGFGITNVTQGILGYWATTQLFRKGRFYLGHLNWICGYFIMFLILLYGWDGLGYDRFLYDRSLFGGAAWTPGAALAGTSVFGAIYRFLFSSVAKTLYLDGAYLIPPLLLATIIWLKEGYARDHERTEPGKKSPGTVRILATLLTAIFGVALGSAALCSLTIYGAGFLVGHTASYFVGIPLFALAAWFLLFKKGRPVWFLLRAL
ncbi:MAG: hypothetical protein GY754_43200 [bacterium]|nr:hypothetical protein [bacterium]